MQKLIYIIVAFITITFSSCESEISVLGPQNISGSADEMRVLVGPDAFDKFTGILGIPIYEGNNPPLLNGEFNLFQILQTADALDPNNAANGRVLGGIYLKLELSNQDPAKTRIDYIGSVWGTGADGIPETGDDEFFFYETALREVFVFGSALPDGTGGFNLFAAGETNGAAENTDTIAISGFITSDGIVDLTYAFVSYDENNTINAGNTWKDEDSFSPGL